jgi:Lrp/AsnC family transcriptional regulator
MTDKIDGIDLRILALLQENTDRSVNDIADAVGLSQNACWRRIKILEEDGVIKKRVALLDPAKLGHGTTVFVMVKTGEHTVAWMEKFAAAVHAMPEIVEFYRMTGDVDYLLKLRVADIQGYDRVYKQLIKAVPLTDVSGAFAMEELKNTTAVPLPTP